MFDRLKAWARNLKLEITVLATAVRDPRTPWYARALGIAIVAYALSPLDLIPDVIPVIGYLDELILLPAALWLVRRMIPAEVLAEYRAKADAGQKLPPSRTAAVVIVALWLLALVFLARWLWLWLDEPWIS